MPRPVKERHVAKLPSISAFGPTNDNDNVTCQDTNLEENSRISMTVDEYEVIRLIDYLGKNQEDAAKCMHVARTTVQAIYVSARKKISKMVVDGSPISIGGGHYKLKNDESCK